MNRLVDSYNDKEEKSLVVFVQDTCRPFLNDFVSFGARFKDPSFSDEREWRLVAVVPSTDPRVQLMAGKSMLVPYVPVNLQIGEGDRVLNLVRVRPTPHLELASNSLTRIFTRVRLGNVTHSAIPYRDW